MTEHPRRRMPDQLRSRLWFDNPDNPGMTALYLERYLNYGLTSEELQVGKPIIGIAQTGSDLSPCNRHHLELANRVREGIPAAGGVALEFPVPSNPGNRQAPDGGARSQSRLSGACGGALRLSTRWRRAHDRMRQDHAGLFDGRGHGRTFPRSFSLAARCSNGWYHGERAGSGTVIWQARRVARRGRDRLPAIHGYCRIIGALRRSLQYHGHGVDHEFACRSAGHVAARVSGDPRAVSRTRADGVSTREGASSTWCVRISSRRDSHDPRGVPERDRRQHGDRRIDKCADPSDRDCEAYWRVA